MSFWDVVWFIVIAFAFTAYLVVMFSIITDLFRDRETSGLAKAVWIVALIFVPFLTAVIYLIARGPGMAERQLRSAEDIRLEQESYIRGVANGGTPADQIARAKAMVDAGTITQGEYERIKEKALS